MSTGIAGRLRVPRDQLWRTAVWILIVAGAYYGAGRLGLAHTVLKQTAPAIWAPAGISLAAVVLGGYRMLPAVAIGAFFTELSTPAPLAAVVMIAIGNTLEAGAGKALLTHFGVDTSLERMPDVAWFIGLAVAASTLIGAIVRVAALSVFGNLSLHGAPSAFRAGWLGDAVGDILVATAILVFAPTPLRRVGVRRVAVGLALVGALSGSAVAFSPTNNPLVFGAVPILLVLAFMFRQRGAVLGGLVAGIAAVGYTDRGEGPFLGGSPSTELIRVQIFIGVATITALVVAAARSERDFAEHARRRLEESERALEEAQRIAQIGSFEWDRKTDRARLSDELYRIFGLDPETTEASYEWWLERIHPDDREAIGKEVVSAFFEGGSFSVVHRIVRPDGVVRHVDFHGRVGLDNDGKPRRLLGTAQDITAIKLVEDRFRGLLETAPDAILIVDQSGEIVLVNSQTERMFGYSRAELIGRPAEPLVPGHFLDGSSELQAAPDEHRLRSFGSGLDVFAQRKDGSRFPVEISLSPLTDSAGTLISAAVRDVTERKVAADALAHQASHDPLTGLPNRTLLLDRLDHALARARRSHSKLAVLFIDLDDFKLVNDTLGHDAGDEMLLALTPLLTSALRPGDTVARFGGDEFVILCEDLHSEAVALDIAERIAAACATPLMLAGREHVVTMSTGIIIVDSGAATPAEVLRDADAAMYRAKAGGKGRVEVFDEGMRARLLERTAIEHALRRAIKQDELRLYYQPVISLARDEIVGFEALLRWEHPERGLLEPSAFMPVAESSGLIVDIGDWVLDHACRQAASWREGRPDGKPLRVSVNISSRQVARADVASSVRRVLAATGLPAELLELEITESTLLDDSDASRRTVQELKKLGVRIVLDDFGTGYSSLSNLQRFTIDAIKIDRSFVEGLGSNPEESAIISAVLGMAQALDVGVTAEGVETTSQMTRLREQGCEYAQGYLFSRPVPEEELADMIAPRASAAEQLLKLIGRVTSL